MGTENLLLLAVLLVLLGEVSYLVVKLPRQTNSKKRKIFVDTSVLIDGRIIQVAKSGFVGDTLVIPRSVIGELQFLADNADHDKRARARFGLDVVKELQDMDELDTVILQDGAKAEEGVDERLLNLAKKHSGSVICTIDYNLNKVAVVEGITVLNVNELAQSLRMSYLPGERMLLELVQKGQDSHQGVGYLKDGTMVVVEHAYKQIGESVEIEFIRSLQTAAGRMMFAKRVEDTRTTTSKTTVEKIQSKGYQQQKKRTEPTVYHSDTSDQRRVKGRAATKQPTTTPKPKARSATTNSQSAELQNQQRRTPRQKTSAQREAALIDLVDNQ